MEHTETQMKILEVGKKEFLEKGFKDASLNKIVAEAGFTKGAFYGSQVSAPIFRDTLQQILVAKGIQPVYSKGLPSFEELNTVSQKADNKPKQLPVLQRMPDGKIKLPDFKGLDMRNTVDLLEPYKLRLKPYGSGHAWQQKPPPGSEVLENTTVEVWFN